MNDHRDSTGEGLWIIPVLIVLLLLLLACGGGGVMWIRQQRVTEAQRAMEQAEIARMQAEINMDREARMRLEAEHNRALHEQLQAESQIENTVPRATDEQTRAQTLVPELYLSQHLWQHVESLVDAAPDARVFSLDPETGQIIFGDGQHGMRPPEGPSTIQATYRTAGGGTVTVSLPAADLRTNPLQATQSQDGTLQLQFSDPPSTEH